MGDTDTVTRGTRAHDAAIRKSHPLADELTHLLSHMGLPEDAALHRSIQELKQWLNERREEGWLADFGPYDLAKLSDVRDRLKLSADERQRLESEGGLSASPEQAQQTEHMLKVARHIDQMLDHKV